MKGRRRFLLADKWRKAFATNYGTDTSSCGRADRRIRRSSVSSERKQLLLLARASASIRGDPPRNRLVFSRSASTHARVVLLSIKNRVFISPVRKRTNGSKRSH